MRKGSHAAAAGIDVRAEELLATSGNELIAVARKHSLSAADAEDALQRAIEKLLTNPPAYGWDDLMPWMVTVVKNEARMLVRGRKHEAGDDFDAYGDGFSSGGDGPEQIAVDRFEAAIGREALLRISPDQARCLLLKADGMSYDEIMQTTEFSYAKVHRCLSEGRRVYRALMERIDSGAECRRLAPLISKYVDSEASKAETADLMDHLTNCLACQAVMRDYRAAPAAAQALFPIGVAVDSFEFGFFQRMAGGVSRAVGWCAERAAAHLPGTPAAEVAMGKKLALATAAAGALVAGGVGFEVAGGAGGTDDGTAASQGRAAAAARAAGKAHGPTSDTGERGREDSSPGPSKRSRPADATAADVTTVRESPQAVSDSPRRAAAEPAPPEVFEDGPDEPESFAPDRGPDEAGAEAFE